MHEFSLVDPNPSVVVDALHGLHIKSVDGL